MRDELWMKHDVRSRLDPKMGFFLKCEGMFGYGVFWSLLETLHYQNEHEIDENMELAGLAHQFGIEESALQRIIDRLVQCDLFKRENGRVYQARLKREQGCRRVGFEASKASMSDGGKLGGILSGMKRRGATSEEIQTFKEGYRRVGRVASRVEGFEPEEKEEKEESISIIDTLVVGGVGESDGKPRTPPERVPSWPPPGDEVRPLVFLTAEQQANLLTHMTPDEREYWYDTLSEAAGQKPAKWKKNYSDHRAVILNWRRRRLEDGKVWNPTLRLYQYPPRANGAAPKETKSLSQIQRERHLALIAQHEAEGVFDGES